MHFFLSNNFLYRVFIPISQKIEQWTHRWNLLSHFF